MRLALLLAALCTVLVAAYAPGPGSPGEAPAPAAARPAARPDSVWTWPEHAENLQVLPDSTSGDELRTAMQSFTRALGVRCSECHVGEGRDFRTWDFASDAKRHKEIARGMMRMTAEINETLLPASFGVRPAGGPMETHGEAHGETHGETHGEVHVHNDGTRHVHPAAAEHGDDDAEHAPEHAEHGERHAMSEEPMGVTCWTCHRGQEDPENLAPPEEHENH